MRRLLAVLAVLIAVAPAQAAKGPRPANGRFTSFNYVLTFVAPPGLYYCRLPSDWVGSDHGTILFFEPPRACTGAGYPSSSRGFEPDVPRIELYYGYHMVDGPIDPCTHRKAGTVRFMGGNRTVCAWRGGGFEIRSIGSLYNANGEKTDGEVFLTLITTPARLNRDYATFVQIAGDLRSCRATDRDAKGKIFSWGEGPACREGNFY